MSKLIQVIPADGWNAVYENDIDGGLDVYPLAAWGLNDEGDFVPIDMDGDGFTASPTRAENFYAIVHDKKLSTVLALHAERKRKCQ